VKPSVGELRKKEKEKMLQDAKIIEDAEKKKLNLKKQKKAKKNLNWMGKGTDENGFEEIEEKGSGGMEIALRKPMHKNLNANHAQIIKQLRTKAESGEFISYNPDGDMKFVEASLPNVLRPLPMITRLMHEVKRFHRWACVYFHYSPTFSRFLRVVTLTTNVITTLFMQALMYNVTNPDDGTCETYATEYSCTVEESPFAYGVSKCYWQVGNRMGLCYFRQPDNSLDVVVFVAVLCALLSIPIVVAIDSIVKAFLCAETIVPKHNENKLISKVRAAARKAKKGQVAPDYTETDEKISVPFSIGTTMQQDLGSFIRHMRAFRANRLKRQEDRFEFDHMWGLATDADQKFKKLAGDDENDAGPRAWLSSVAKGAQVQIGIMSDLGITRSRAEDEVRDLSTIDSNKLKGERLLYLFQQDLMSNSSGAIMENKRKRDLDNVKYVSPLTKMLSWAFVFLFNFSMFLYILLFALDQSDSRQGALLKSFGIWFASEVFVVSTAVTIIIHFILPNLIMKDLDNIKRRVVDNIRDYKEKVLNGSIEAEVKDRDAHDHFNAAQYFFVSFRVAEQFPGLRESKFIMHFKSAWPKRAYGKKEKDVSAAYNGIGQILGRSVSMVVMFLINNLVNIPDALQDMVFEAVSSATVGFTSLMHIRLFNISPMFALLPAMLIALVLHFYLRSPTKTKKSMRPLSKLDATRSNFKKPWNRKFHPGDYYYNKEDEEIEVESLDEEMGESKLDSGTDDSYSDDSEEKYDEKLKRAAAARRDSISALPSMINTQRRGSIMADKMQKKLEGGEGRGLEIMSMTHSRSSGGRSRSSHSDYDDVTMSGTSTGGSYSSLDTNDWVSSSSGSEKSNHKHHRTFDEHREKLGYKKKHEKRSAEPVSDMEIITRTDIVEESKSPNAPKTSIESIKHRMLMMAKAKMAKAKTAHVAPEPSGSMQEVTLVNMDASKFADLVLNTATKNDEIIADSPGKLNDAAIGNEFSPITSPGGAPKSPVLQAQVHRMKAMQDKIEIMKTMQEKRKSMLTKPIDTGTGIEESSSALSDLAGKINSSIASKIGKKHGKGLAAAEHQHWHHQHQHHEHHHDGKHRSSKIAASHSSGSSFISRSDDGSRSYDSRSYDSRSTDSRSYDSRSYDSRSYSGSSGDSRSYHSDDDKRSYHSNDDRSYHSDDSRGSHWGEISNDGSSDGGHN
jgi:hypothetical protein